MKSNIIKLAKDGARASLPVLLSPLGQMEKNELSFSGARVPSLRAP